MPATTETNSVQAAVWTTAYVDSLPNSSFAYIDKDGGRHLPYKDKDGKVDLPHTRNALARLNQVKGMSPDERDKVRAKLQGALKNAKAADDIVLQTRNAIQASDDGTLPDRVHLLREGEFNTSKYGKVPITAADIRGMKTNFDQGVGMPNDGKETGIPVDFSHKAGDLAAAWIHDLEVVEADDGFLDLYGTRVEWSRAGREAVEGKEFKYISADFYPAAFGEWVDPESGIVATSVMVGAGLTNRPMFTGNRAVMASEVDDTGEAEATGVKTVIYVNATSEIKEKKSMDLDQLRVKAADEVTGAEQRFLQAHASELSADERKKFELVEPVAAAEEKKDDQKEVKASEVKGDEGKVVVEASELKATNEKVAELEASVASLKAEQQKSEEQNIREEVTTHAQRGAIKADAIEPWTKMILAAQGEGREMLLNNLKSLADNPLVGKTFGSGQTQGSAEMDIEAEIEKKTRELMASNDKLDVYAARKQVLASDPDLAQRAAEAAKAALNGSGMLASAWGTEARGLQNVNPEVSK